MELQAKDNIQRKIDKCYKKIDNTLMYMIDNGREVNVKGF